MLIAMAVWDTKDNKRTWMTEKTLLSLADTVDWEKHKLIVSDNGSCEETWKIYERMSNVMPISVIPNGENIGTARAINRAWSFCIPGQHLIKMDNDVVINQRGWVDEIEEVFSRDPEIGICGLKRKDLAEYPDNPVEFYKSNLRMLPHVGGQTWIVVEEVKHVMGTCQAYSYNLFERIGFLYQGQDEGKVYGLDDSLASVRSHLAGFKTVFLPHISIDHIDPGNDAYSSWKQDIAANVLGFNGGVNWMNKVVDEYKSGKRSIYYNGESDGKYAMEVSK